MLPQNNPPQIEVPSADLLKKSNNTHCGGSPRLLLLLGLLFFCVNCSGLLTGRSREMSKPPIAAELLETQAVLAELNRKNALLDSFKGLGKIKVWQDGQLKIDERVAWIGSAPNKLSIVLMVSGFPAIKMASDGKWFYYYEVGEGKGTYKKISATDASLKRIISIPIQPSDIMNLIAGRVPLREYHTAILQKQESGQGYVLALKRHWWGIVEKIHLEEDKQQIRMIEYFNRTGSLSYRVRFDEMQLVNGYQVPAKLSISNGNNANFQLDVYQYYTNVPVTASMFVLNPPD
jgi:hypothetical protein